jgi:hypothetical protein
VRTDPTPTEEADQGFGYGPDPTSPQLLRSAMIDEIIEFRYQHSQEATRK